jgi:tRNA pseudouridine38-40 synthase
MTETRRIRIDFEYLGTAYAGWQWQDNALSIQEVAEKALQKLVNHKVRLTASGRTDSGVHALFQPAHGDVATRMEDVQIWRGLNAVLPKDIAVRGVATVPAGWDARQCAIRKTYRYTILNREEPSVFLRGRVWHFKNRLDMAPMIRAAANLLGQRDFSSFRSAGYSGDSPIRRIMEIRIWRERAEDEIGRLAPAPPYAGGGRGDGSLVLLSFTADGFLKQMVRNMVGTLVEVGKGKLAPEAMAAILEAKDRQAAGPCAPAEGLCLLSVEYS